MKKIVIGLILGISVFFIGCGKTNNIKEPSKKTVKIIKLDRENAININYDNKDYEEILHLFKTNEVKAKDKYLKKTVKITGEVTKISESNNGITISVMTKDKFYGANLEFEDIKDKEKLMNLKVYDDSEGYHNIIRGDIITVYGIFDQYKDGVTIKEGDRISIKHCQLTKK